MCQQSGEFSAIAKAHGTDSPWSSLQFSKKVWSLQHIDSTSSTILKVITSPVSSGNVTKTQDRDFV